MTLRTRIEKLEASPQSSKFGLHNEFDNTWFYQGAKITQEEWEALPGPKNLVTVCVAEDLDRL